MRRPVDARPGEAAPALWAFASFFSLLAGYYVLRSLREEMGIRGGVDNLPWNFTATFGLMLVAVPIYSRLVARVPRARAVPLVYRFFLVTLLGFWALFRAGVAPAPLARAFFVWVSVYGLFVVSVFWSLLVDLFTTDQGKRLFGFVAAGGSAGAIAGPLCVELVVGLVGVANLVLVSAALLEVSTQAMVRIIRWSRRSGAAEARAADAREADGSGAEGAALGGSAWSGVVLVFRDRYLLGIAGQMLLFTLGSTLLYFQVAHLVAASGLDSASRTRLFARVDLAVNVAALLTGSLATGRIVSRARAGCRAGARARPHGGRIRHRGRLADLLGAGRIPGAPTGRQLCRGAAGPGGPLHRGDARGAIQVEGLRRHGGLPRRRRRLRVARPRSRRRRRGSRRQPALRRPRGARRRRARALARPGGTAPRASPGGRRRPA